MPCIGPGINEQKFEEAYQDIMSYLLIRHKIQMYSETGLFTLDQRKEVNAKFKEALKELFFRDACEGF